MTQIHGHVGWVGSGRMGSAMVRRLLAAGTQVTVWNRTPGGALDLIADGAVFAEKLANATAHPVVFTSVGGSDDLIDVVEQIASAAAVPEVVVDTSTVSTTASSWARERCARRGVRFLSAPVSGNPTAVAAGNASFVCSGSPEAYNRARPMLEHIGRSARFVGAGDEAPLLKICHNLLLATVTQGLAEVLVLCEALGVSRTALMEFINTSALGSTFTAYKTPMIADLDMTPTFTTRLLLKDLELGVAEAKRAPVPLPLGTLVHTITQAAVANGYADLDFFSLLLAQAEAAGITLAAPDASELIERTP